MEPLSSTKFMQDNSYVKWFIRGGWDGGIPWVQVQMIKWKAIRGYLTQRHYNITKEHPVISCKYRYENKWLNTIGHDIAPTSVLPGPFWRSRLLHLRPERSSSRYSFIANNCVMYTWRACVQLLLHNAHMYVWPWTWRSAHYQREFQDLSPQPNIERVE